MPFKLIWLAVISKSDNACAAPTLPASVTVPVPATTVRVRSKAAASSAFTAPLMIKLLSPVPSVVTVIALAPRTTEPVQVEVAPPAPPLRFIVALLILIISPVKFRLAKDVVAPTAWASVISPKLPAVTVSVSVPTSPSIVPTKLILAPSATPTFELIEELLSTVMPLKADPRVITSPELCTVPPRWTKGAVAVKPPLKVNTSPPSPKVNVPALLKITAFVMVVVAPFKARP